MATLKTIHGTEFEVDPEDVSLTEGFIWFSNYDGQIVRFKSGKPQKLADLILGKTGKIIYKNGNKKDLTKANIRSVSTAVVRLENAHKRGDTEKGLVYNKKRELWEARLHFDTKRTLLGRFKTKEEALVRLEAVKAELMLEGRE